MRPAGSGRCGARMVGHEAKNGGHSQGSAYAPPRRSPTRLLRAGRAIALENMGPLSHETTRCALKHFTPLERPYSDGLRIEETLGAPGLMGVGTGGNAVTGKVYHGVGTDVVIAKVHWTARRNEAPSRICHQIVVDVHDVGGVTYIEALLGVPDSVVVNIPAVQRTTCPTTKINSDVEPKATTLSGTAVNPVMRNIRTSEVTARRRERRCCPDCQHHGYVRR